MNNEKAICEVLTPEIFGKKGEIKLYVGSSLDGVVLKVRAPLKLE